MPSRRLRIAGAANTRLVVFCSLSFGVGISRRLLSRRHYAFPTLYSPPPRPPRAVQPHYNVISFPHTYSPPTAHDATAHDASYRHRHRRELSLHILLSPSAAKLSYPISPHRLNAQAHTHTRKTSPTANHPYFWIARWRPPTNQRGASNLVRFLSCPPVLPFPVFLRVVASS